MDTVSTECCFLLSHSCRDRAGRCVIDLFGVNAQRIPVHITITGFRPMFFTLSSVDQKCIPASAERKTVALKAFSGASVDCLYFPTYAAFIEGARAMHAAMAPTYESDVHPVDRFLMERMVQGGFEAIGPAYRHDNMIKMTNPRIRGADMKPDLSVMSIDIETNVASGSIYSIACSGVKDIVFISGCGPDQAALCWCRDEKEVLERFLYHLDEQDPDILIGWNVIDFDVKTIAERCRLLGVAFCAGRGKRPASVFASRTGNRTIARIDGRVIIDVPVLLRTYYDPFEEYSLNFVATELLGKEKEITLTGEAKIAAIDALYASDKPAFARYNLQDARLTNEIFDRTSMLPNAIERSRRSGHLLDRAGGSIAAFDWLYLPRLHRAGFVAPDTPDAASSDIALPGGYVIEPRPGIYKNVLVFDFRSLYPSIIMSFNIDPLGFYLSARDRIKGPAGPSFSREGAILPEIIRELLDAREGAKREKNSHLSQAIKILMNSFYGVLGARNCRFFSAEIASAITQIGQYILKKSIDYITSTTSFPVIYGDTDSIFVHIGQGRELEAQLLGSRIAHDVTNYFRDHLTKSFNAESSLLLQFEKHFNYFLIPSVRGATHGSKKHYCGGTFDGDMLELHFKGMESARSDWTDLAKELQQELIRRIFKNEPIEDYLNRLLFDVTSGRLDDKLIYKKRLRKEISDYTQSVPLHVQAARLLDYHPHLVRYFITVDGPQPIEKKSSPLDYRHYIDCQLQPVADSVLELVGKSFTGIVSGQQELFG